MRSFCLSLLCIFFVITQSVAQLQWLNPQPSGFHVTNIQFVNSSDGYMMNTDGDFFISHDAGDSWQSKGHYPLAQKFRFSDSTGVIPLWDSTCYISNDNGISWQPKRPGGNLLPWVDIIGRDTIFLLKGGVVANVTFFRSIDCGRTWQTITSNADQFFSAYIDFITSKIGYALRPDGLYKTVDGGFTWQIQYTPSGGGNNFKALKFYDTENGIMYRDYDSLLKTSDGGKTWKSVHTYPAYIYDITYADRNTAYATGEGGIVFKTNDGGDSWNFKNPPDAFLGGYDLSVQYFFNASSGIAAGLRGKLLKTNDGGNTWKAYSPFYVDVSDVSFGDKNTGYATTWNNVYKTSDAGKNWNALSLSTDPAAIPLSRFERCLFANKDTGFVTVNNPVRIYRTTNGGSSWTLSNPGATRNFSTIAALNFVTNDTGYVSLVGDDFYQSGLYKTVNGGATWQEVGTNQTFANLFFITGSYGYASNYVYLYRTFDGGNTWTQLSNYGNVVPVALSFSSASTGFIPSTSGYLQMTEDSGKTWKQTPSNTFLNRNPVAMKFYNQRIGYLTDDDGNILKTVDGGYSWRVSQKASAKCTVIAIRQDTSMIFAGLYGAIVSDRVDGYTIDSLQARLLFCGTEFSAVVTSAINKIDSIFFEYGMNDFTRSIKANPSSVKDSTINTNAVVSGLSADSIYKARMKLFSKGQYYYSDEISLKPNSIAKPIITVDHSILSSSYALGNQWYVNDSLIPGATNQVYIIRSVGRYSVKVNQNGCSAVSDTYNFSRIPGSVFNSNSLISIFPNPVLDNEFTVAVRRYRNLSLRLYDLFGRRIINQRLFNSVNHISLAGLERGIYFAEVEDDEKKIKISVTRIIKL